VNVLVDTCVWSLALRRSPTDLDETGTRVVELLRELVTESRAVLIGPIRQEILSGVREKRVFERLREHLSAFEEQPIGIEEYEEAARCANRCRAAGVAGSSVDFLICAVSLRRKLAILTTDRDFKNYAKVLPITVLPEGMGFRGRQEP